MEYVTSQARLGSLEIVEEVADPAAFARGLAAGVEVFIPLAGGDFSEETARIKREIAKLEEESKRFQAKLSNDQFLSKAPAEVVQKERRKLADNRLKIEKLREQLTLLGE